MKKKEKEELIKTIDWYETCYWSKIDAFNRLKNAWKAHESDWEMIDKIARNIIIKTKPEYDKCEK